MIGENDATGHTLMGGDASAERAWAEMEDKACETETRVLVVIGRTEWERAMKPAHDVAIYALRARLGRAGHVHVLALRDAGREQSENVSVQIARERCEMTMHSCRTG